MASIALAPGVEMTAEDFFAGNPLETVNETLSNLLSTTGALDLLGQGEIVSHFGEYVFEAGDRTYRYIGDFVSTVSQSLLGSTSSLTGGFHTVIIEEAGEIIAQLNLDDLIGLDLGSLTSLNLLGLNIGQIVGGLVDNLLGDNLSGILDGILDPVGDVVDTLLDTVQGLLDDVQDGDGGAGDPTNGDDTINGTVDDDVIDGLGGNDIIRGKGGDDVLHGGGGNDILFGNGGDDLLFGDTGNDILIGGPGRDKLSGGDGKDVLEGAASKDKLNGGDHDDILFGGKGSDVLKGGDGADDFVFRSANDSRASKGVDIIRDFSHKEDDVIDIRKLDGDNHKGGNQDLDFIGRQGFSDTAGELRYAHKGSDTIIQGDFNGDGKADFTLRIDDHVKLHDSDFLM